MTEQVVGKVTHLYSNPVFSDVLLIAEGYELRAHRCILSTVSYFEAAFRTGASMKEGESSIFTMKLEMASSSLRTFVSYVYGNEFVLPTEISSILTLIAECRMFEYKPFLDKLWDTVETMRAQYTTENGVHKRSLRGKDRAQSIAFAATQFPINTKLLGLLN